MGLRRKLKSAQVPVMDGIEPLAQRIILCLLFQLPSTFGMASNHNSCTPLMYARTGPTTPLNRKETRLKNFDFLLDMYTKTGVPLEHIVYARYQDSDH